MINNRLFSIIKRPHVSEKTARVSAEDNQYVFEVNRNANKLDIKQAVESLFEVSVEAVQVVSVPGKSKAFRGRPGNTKGWKKAYVRLAEGQSIDLVDGEQA